MDMILFASRAINQWINNQLATTDPNAYMQSNENISDIMPIKRDDV